MTGIYILETEIDARNADCLDDNSVKVIDEISVGFDDRSVILVTHFLALPREWVSCVGTPPRRAPERSTECRTFDRVAASL